MRHGCTLWALCRTLGYCYNVDLYCGKMSVDERIYGMLVGNIVAMDMLEAVKIPNSHCVFFDNFLTGYDLLVRVRSLGYKSHRYNKGKKTQQIFRKTNPCYEEGKTRLL